jgi:hypothetical protein
VARRKIPLAVYYSAFMCPGMGQLVNGQRIKGMILITSVVAALGWGFVRFLGGGRLAGPCPWDLGVWSCIWWTFVRSWELSRSVVLMCLLAVAVIYVVALIDAWLVAKRIGGPTVGQKADS